MATFDQRNQKVKRQYNASGDINFGSAQNNAELLNEFKKLQNELRNAIAEGESKHDLPTDIEEKIKEVIKQIESPKPDKKSILEHLQEAQALIGGVTSATGLIKMLVEAAEVIRRLF